METIKGVPQAAFELAYNGKGITADIAPYVLSIDYTDNLAGESDELDVELEDADGRWLNAWYPGKGAELTYAFGYLGQPLVKAGIFYVDRIELSGPPSVVRLRGLATGVQNAVRTRNPKPYEKTSLAAIAQRIAKRHKLTLIGSIEALPIDRATQYHETDLTFLNRLAKDYGYAVKWLLAEKKLVFTKIAALAVRSAIRRFTPEDMSSWRASDQINDVPGEVEAKYHNPKTKKLVAYGVKEGQIAVVGQTDAGKSSSADTVKLARRAPTKQAAEAMAAAELQRRHLERTSAEISVEGDAALAAGTIVELADLGKLSGSYIATKAHHRIGRAQGFTTALELKRVMPSAGAKAAQARPAKAKGLVVYGMKDGQLQQVGTTNKEKIK